MSRFLDPPKAGKPLAEDKVDKTYKVMRTKVFLGAFFGYAAYYLVRKNLSLAAPDMIHDGIIDAGKAGLAMSAVSIAYAFSKFIMGSVSDRSDARKFLCVGLVLSALTMILTGVIPFGANTAVNTAVIFTLMLVVGWLSGFGWPPTPSAVFPLASSLSPESCSSMRSELSRAGGETSYSLLS